MKRLPLPLEPLIYPLAGLYKSIMSSRNLAFDRGWLPSHEVGRPVISIGNLTAGGTGKTPLTALLVEGFLRRGKRIGLVSRGYGGTEKGPARVPSDGTAETARRFGDETAWLAHRYPSVPVVIAAKRVEAARLLIEECDGNIDLILADDAFQHRWLKRSLDAVVLDPTEPEWHYRPLPLGRTREGFDSLARADAVFLTKTNLAAESQVKWLLSQVARVAKAHKRHPLVFELESYIPFFLPLAGGRSMADLESRSVSSFKGERVLLVSGIGRPHTFARLIRNIVHAEVLEHLVFNDHHSYSEANLAAIEARAVQLGAGAILVTEKDAVKMSNWRPRVPCWASRLETRAKGDLGAFYEAVDRLLL